MATRKQRRRREKEKRHEYEIVEIDGEGNETVLSTSELRTDNGSDKPTRAAKGSSPGRGRGPLQPPSWRRVIKRGAIFAPIFFATVLLLNGNNGYRVAVANTILLLAVFVPFSYFMDRMMWRMQQKRMAKPGA
jgi:hypothetical protein